MGMLSEIRRTPAGYFSAQSEQRADNDYAIYLQPLGNGRHLVRRPCNDEPYSVGGPFTFTPGTVVLTSGSNGFQGEVILTAPPHVSGASAAPVRFDRRVVNRIPEEEVVDPCPAVVTGKTYVGVYHHEATKKIYAWLFNDGTYDSVISILDWTALLSFADIGHSYLAVASYSPLKLVFYGERSGRSAIVTWNVVANTINVSEISARATLIYGFTVSAGNVYGYEWVGGFGADRGRTYPFTSAVGAEGVDGAAMSYPLGYSTYWDALAGDGLTVEGVQAIGSSVYYRANDDAHTLTDKLLPFPNHGSESALGGVGEADQLINGMSLVGGGGVCMTKPGGAGNHTPCYIASAGAPLVEVWPQSWGAFLDETPIIPSPDGSAIVAVVNATTSSSGSIIVRTPSRVAIDGACPRPETVLDQGSIAQCPDYMIPVD